MVEYTQITNNLWALTEEGNQIAETGSHEYRVWSALPEAGQPGLSVKDLTVRQTSRRSALAAWH